MQTKFVDVRLHVSVRPKLEYKIPETGRIILDFLTDNATQENVLNALEDMTSEPVPPTLDDTPPSDTKACCVLVCCHVREHLTNVSEQWKQFLSSSRRIVKVETDKLGKELERIKYVKEKYGPSRDVEREFRREVERLYKELDSTVTSVRNAPEPCIKRSETLTTSSDELKRMFATSYGSTPTKTLLDTKQAFEAELETIEHEIAKVFVKFVTRLL